MKSHTYKELSTAAVFTAAVVLFSAGFSAALLLLGCLCPGIYKIGKGLALINSESYFFTKGDIDTVTEGAMKGIAEYLPDGYSAYFTEEEYDALLEGESGISIGIGIVLEETATGFFTVTEVYDNTPASDSGLLVQDRIVSVNGECAEDMSLEDFIRFFHVGDGEDNLITVERNGEELSISVTAKEYYVPYAEYEMIDEKTGYLRIKSFHGKVTDDVSKSLDEMQTLGMKQLVIDVRDNLGGLLSDALDIADLFCLKAP